MKKTALITATLAVALALPALARAKKLSPVKDEGILSPVHKAYKGKIIFSKKPIPRAPQNKKGFTTSFKLSEPIFMRPMLAESMENSMRKKG